MTEVEDAEDFREALGDLLAEAQAAGVPTGELTALMTVYLAAVREDVRLPLSVSPERAREFHDRFEENLGETAEFELLVTGEVLEDIDLQLEAFEDDPV